MDTALATCTPSDVGRWRVADLSVDLDGGAPVVAGSPTVSVAPMRSARSRMISRPKLSSRGRPEAARRRPRSRSVARGGSIRQVTHRLSRVGVLAGVGDGLLGDPQQLGLGVGAQPAGGLVEDQVHGEVGARRRPART